VVGAVTHDYRYVAADLAAPGPTVADLPLSDVTWGRRLNGAGEFSASLKLPPPVDTATRLLIDLWKEATDRATKCVYVLRDGVPVGCYAIWSTKYTSSDQTIKVGGAELFSYARRRIIEPSSKTLTEPLIFTNARAIDIAVSLISEVNEIGLIFDVAGSGGTVMSKTYLGADARVLADEIGELAALDPGGFDFRTDVRLNSSGDMERVWIAREFLGGTTEIVAKYGTNVGTLGVDRRGDLRANDALVMGPTKAGDSSQRLIERASTSEWFPTMSVVEAHSDDQETASIMAKRATGLLEGRRNQELLEIELVASEIDAQLGTFHPGDVMRLTVNRDADPFYHAGLDASLRLLGYSVKVPDTGGGAEIVTLTLDESGL
jgi:hypothetical protein